MAVTANQHISNPAPTTSAAMQLVSSRPGRFALIIQNQGAYDVYLGPDTTVTTSGATRGYLLPGGQSPPAEWPPYVMGGAVYAIASGGIASLFVDDRYPD